MHPQIRKNAPGQCPICGMDLIPLDNNDKTENADENEVQITESAMKLAEIETYTVKKGIPEKTIHLLEKVQPDERNVAALTARFGGRIEKLYVNFKGQYVKKGKKLASIYSPELHTSQQELLNAVKYKNENFPFYKAIRNKLKLWELTDKQIDAIEQSDEPSIYFDILSSISGTVTRKDVAIGDYVKEGDALFEVINLHKVWVLFDIYETDIPWIKMWDTIKFSIPSLPGKKFTRKISFIDPFIDQKERVAKARVEVLNPKLILKPGMFANGVLKSKLTGNNEKILIPKTSILWTGEQAIVYVKVPNREKPSFIYRQITLGPEMENFYVVLDGLHEGEEIATYGVFKIDASAQLLGKKSMMNPKSGKVSTGHKHEATD